MEISAASDAQATREGAGSTTAAGPSSDGRAALGRRGFSHEVRRQVDEAVGAIRQRWRRQAAAGLILGTGMGSMADHIEAEVSICYGDIPHFPCSTAISHRGRLVCGRLGDAAVVTMDGRCHVYEGYSLDQVTLPIHVMRRLGAQVLIASNACGGLNPKFATGDVMVVADHINLLGRTPLVQWCDGAFGRHSASPYDAALIEQALAVARRENFAAYAGTYIAVPGPNYETRAEYRAFRRIGGDAVGMSTVPEALVAAWLGMRVFAVSTVTNVARPDSPQTVTAEEVVAAAERAEPRVRKIMVDLVHSARQ